MTLWKEAGVALMALTWMGTSSTVMMLRASDQVVLLAIPNTFLPPHLGRHILGQDQQPHADLRELLDLKALGLPRHHPASLPHDHRRPHVARHGHLLGSSATLATEPPRRLLGYTLLSLHHHPRLLSQSTS